MNYQLSNLVDVLGRFRGIISSKGKQEVYSHVLLSGGFATGFGGVVGLRVPFPADGIDAAVPFDRFFGLLKNLKADKVAIELIDADVLQVGWGRSRFKLSILRSKSYPDFTNLFSSLTDGWEPPSDLSEGISACLPFTAQRALKTGLSGVCLKSDTARAADGKQVGVYRFSAHVVSEPTVLTHEFCREMIKLPSALNFFADTEKVVIAAGDNVLFGPILGSSYPEVASFFPKEVSTFTLPNKLLIEGLSRVGDFSEEKVHDTQCAVEFGDSIRIQYRSASATLTEYLDLGDTLPKQVRMSVNPYQLLRMLERCTRFSLVLGDPPLFYGEAGDPVVFKAVLAVGVTKSKGGKN